MKIRFLLRSFVTFAVACLILAGCGSTSQLDGIKPEVQGFFESHSEFGQPQSVYEIPDWANGSRQGVQMDNGRELVFYIQNGQVVTVREGSGAGPIIWGQGTG